MRMAQVLAGLVVMSLVSTAWAGAADCGKSNPAAFATRKELGRLEVADELNKRQYGFAVCEERDTANQRLTLRIHATPVTGTYWDQADAEKLARALAARGERCEPNGAPYNPVGKEDRRRIVYLLCQEGGKPARVEVRITALKADGSAQTERVLSVTWPK